MGKASQSSYLHDAAHLHKSCILCFSHTFRSESLQMHNQSFFMSTSTLVKALTIDTCATFAHTIPWLIHASLCSCNAYLTKKESIHDLKLLFEYKCKFLDRVQANNGKNPAWECVTIYPKTHIYVQIKVIQITDKCIYTQLTLYQCRSHAFANHLNPFIHSSLY